jgi:hypothetical protein
VSALEEMLQAAETENARLKSYLEDAIQVRNQRWQMAKDAKRERYEVEHKIEMALAVITCSGGVDGSHHKQWTLDQVVRALTGSKVEDGLVVGDVTDGYREWLRQFRAGDDGPETYDWDEGIAP